MRNPCWFWHNTWFWSRYGANWLQTHFSQSLPGTLLIDRGLKFPGSVRSPFLYTGTTHTSFHLLGTSPVRSELFTTCIRWGPITGKVARSICTVTPSSPQARDLPRPFSAYDSSGSVTVLTLNELPTTRGGRDDSAAPCGAADSSVATSAPAATKWLLSRWAHAGSLWCSGAILGSGFFEAKICRRMSVHVFCRWFRLEMAK